MPWLPTGPARAAAAPPDGARLPAPPLGPLRGGLGALRLDQDYIASAFLNPDVVAGVPLAFEPGLPRHVVVGVTIGRR